MKQDYKVIHTHKYTDQQEREQHLMEQFKKIALFLEARKEGQK